MNNAVAHPVPYRLPSHDTSANIEESAMASSHDVDKIAVWKPANKVYERGIVGYFTIMIHYFLVSMTKLLILSVTLPLHLKNTGFVKSWLPESRMLLLLCGHSVRYACSLCLLL